MKREWAKRLEVVDQWLRSRQRLQTPPGQRLTSLGWEEVCDLFEAALLPESWPVLDDIVGQLDEAQNGQSAPPAEPLDHGLILWLSGLQIGWCLLPETIPPPVLVAYRDWPSTIPLWRCEDCRMALPHHTVEYQFRPCPVCGSAWLFHADLGRPWGEAWIDPEQRGSARLAAPSKKRKSAGGYR